MNNFISRFFKKVSPKALRKKTSKWNSHQIKLDLLKLEERLVPAPNLLTPTTSSTAPLAFTPGSLNLSGPLAINLLDTPTPASTTPLRVSIATSAGTASVGTPSNVTVTGDGTNNLQIQGPLTDINAALANLVYSNNTANATPATITVSASDNASTPLTDSKTIYVRVADPALAPTITTVLADVAYTAETAATPVARPTIAVVVNDPQGATGVVVTTTNDNPNLINSISVAGTYPNFTLAISTKTGITGTAVVTVKVSDGTNFTTKSFKVVVTPSPYTLSVETLAGRTTSTGSTGYTDGTGSAATFTNPRGATADNRGLIYVQDGNLIRSIDTAGVVTTLAGTTTATTRVDGVGTAAGIPALGTSTYAAMKVSPDNNWLYFMNGGWLRKMGINPSDTANYKNVTSVMAFAGAPDGGGGLVFSSDGTKIFQVFNLKIKRFDLTNNTISDLNPDGNAANNVSAAWMVQGPNNTAFLRYHPGFGTTAYFGGLFRVDLNTGAFTRLANNPLNGDTMNGSPAYNPDTNEILVDTNASNPKILDASTGALKYTLPAANTTTMYTNGVGTSFDATDAITYFGGIYYLSQSGPATTNAANIRAVKPAPGLYNPGTQIFTEGQTNYFDNFSLEKIGVTGNGSTSIAYTLTALYGTLDVSTVTNLTGVTGRGTKSLSFTGSESTLNAALATLAYTPDAGFINANSTGTQISGVPFETLTATATGTNAGGLTLGTNTATTNVLVKAINNNPRIITPLPDRTYLVEQAVSTETVINFTIADADTANTSFTNNATTGARISITSDNPNLILPADIAVAIGGSAGARTLTIKHQPNITGVANVTVTISDGTNQNTYPFKVTVLPSPSYYWDILAGSAAGTAGFANATGTSAAFRGPNSIVKDPDGNLIVGDTGNFRIRKVTPQGLVTTLVGSGQDGYNLLSAGGSANVNKADPLQTIIAGMQNCTVAPNRDIYFTDVWTPSTSSNVVRLRATRWDPTANSGAGAYGVTVTVDENPGFLNGMMVTPDNLSLIYYTGTEIRKYNLATRTTTSIAGSSTVSGTADGTGSAALFTGISGISFDSNNDILVNQANNEIRKVTLQGVVTTINPNLTGTSSQRNALALPGGAYLRSIGANALQYSANGDSATIAGSTTAGTAVGVNLNATFNNVYGLVAGSGDLIYLLSTSANNIRYSTTYPTLLNPGAQSTNMGTRLAFNSADFRQLGAVANAVDSNNNPLPITLTLSAQYGTLDFNSVAAPTGVTVTFGTGNRSVTLTGNETAIKTYLLNFGYTPDTGYVNANSSGGALASGAVSPDVLSMSVTTANNLTRPVTGSLNLLVKGDNIPRIISALPDRTYYVESGIATETAITLTIADGDTVATSFTNNATTGGRITVISDNPNLILPADMATAIGGTGNARTLTIKHQANITGVANVTITISDGTNSSTSNFKVTVVPTPRYYWGILAGSPSGTAGSVNGSGTAASFNAPVGLVRDSQGNLFVSDNANHVIRKVTPQGVVTTFAGTQGAAGFADGTGTAAKFNAPLGMAIDAQDNIYVADQSNNRIRKITSAGVVTTIAGTGTAGSANGAAASATFNLPTGIAINSAGDIFVGDRSSYTIRKISGGQVTTLAGLAATSGFVDGIGSAARFNAPGAINLTPAGLLLVRDINNSGAIRQVDPATGAVTTLYSANANMWADGGVDSNGLIYAPLSANTISLISSFDSTVLVGTGTAGSVLGVNTSATVADARAVAFAPDRTIYFTSTGQNNIRVGTPYPSLRNPGAQSTNEATRLAFSNTDLQQLGAFSNALNTAGTASLPITLKLSAQFGTLDFNNVAVPNGLTVTGVGTSTVTLTGDESLVNSYLANFGYTPNTGYINANASGGALASGAVSPDVLSMSVTNANNINSPVTGSLNVVVKAADNAPRIITPLANQTYLAADTTAAITENIINFTIADADTLATAFTNNATTGARITITSDNPNLILPADIATAIGGTGNARTLTIKHQPNITGVANLTVTINDGTLQNTYSFSVVVKPAPSFYWGTLTTQASGAQITYDSNGDLIALNYTLGTVWRITPQGSATLLKSGFTNPLGLAIDANKNLYVSDGDGSIKKVPFNSSNNTYGTTAVLASGVSAGEILISPDGSTLYGGKLYQIVKINTTTGAVTVLAGSGTTGSADGTGLSASFSYARYLAWDNSGNILAAESNYKVRQVTLAGVVTTLPAFANAPSLSPHQNTIVQTREGYFVGMVAAPKVSVSTPDGLSAFVSSSTNGLVDGLNKNAQFSSQRGGVVTPDGKIYLSDVGVGGSIRTGTIYPSLRNPGTQATNEGTRLAFSSSNLQQLGAFSNALNTAGTASLPITLKLSVQFGTLNFNNVAVPAGVTVTGVGTGTVTLTGDEAAVNTYLANFGYTPNAGYINANMSGGALASGAIAPDVLSMSVTTANNITNPVTGSLNLLVKATDNKPRIVSPLPDRMYYAEPGVATETAITLTLADADTVATAFVNNATTGARITMTSDNPNLILPADIATAIGGTGNARTLTIKHQANITGEANVTITINDGALQNTYTFKVTVVPAPQYYWSILAGSSTGAAGTANGTGTSATFSSPFGMVRDSQGNLFVSDAGNHGIRKITPQGVVTTFAGTLGTAGFADGTGTAAKFNAPTQLAIDASDNIYVADQLNHRIRRITPAGLVTTIAGTGTLGGTDGAVASATFNQPTGIAITPTGVIYVADKFGHTIRKIDGGQVTTLAGTYGIGQFADGVGSAARFNRPTGLGLLPDGNLLVRDSVNNNIRLLNITTLAVTTYATSAINQDGPPNISPTGDLYATVLDNTVSVFSSFDSAKLAGTGTAGSVVGDNATATFSLPRSMAFAPNGTLYLVSGGANNIRMGSPIPSLANPGKQVVADTQLLTFASAATQRLSIQSNGAAEPLTLTLAVTKGKVTLSQLTGLTFTAGDGTADATMTFSGTVADINAALNNLVYDFDEVANPTSISDTLTLTAPWSANGSSGSVVQTVPIQIVKAPVITPITNILVGVGSTITPAAFTVTDADTAANALTYTITSSNTNLIPNTGLVRTGGTGATGSTVPANAQNSLAITPITGRTGSTTVTIAVSDGNITTTRTFTVTVSPIVGAPDLIAASDTGSSSTDNITSDNTPTFSVTLGTGVQAGDVVGIYNGSTKIGEAIVTSADIQAGSIQITTSPISDGSYSNITSSVVFGTDRGIASTALSPQLVIDSTAPGSPTGLADLATASDTGSSTTDNVTNDTTPTFSIPLAGTGAVAGDVIELYNGSTLIGTYTLTSGDITANGASMTTSTLPAGTYSDVKFRIVDTAGNASAYSGSMAPAMVIDLGAPTLVTLSPADNATNLVPPTTLVMTFNEDMAKGVTGTIVIKKTSDNSTVETFNVATSSRVMITGSKVTLNPATTLDYGTGYYVTVDSTALTDTAGNTYAGLSQATDWNFTTLSIPGAVDLTSASDTGASSTDNITNLTSIALDVALNPGTQVGDVIKLYDGVTLVGSVTVDSTMLGNGKVTFNLTNQTAGVHSYSATLSNGAGESPATAALLVTIDTSAPTAPSMSLDPASDTGTQGDGKTKDSTPTLNGTAEPGSVINLYIDGSTTPVSVIADSNGNWTYTPTTPLADGSHSIVATQTDPAGNTSPNSAPILFNIDTTAPLATATSPADNSTVSPPSSISITFNEPVVLGSFGSVTIFDDTTSTSLVIPFSSSQLSVSGNVLTITPTTPFLPGTNYHVEIGSGVIRDVSGNLYAGISNTTDWNFTTNNAPATPTMDLRATSDTGAFNTDNKTNLTTLTFDIKVPAGAAVGDTINVYDGTNPTPVGTITLASGDITAGTVALTLSGVSTGIHSYTSTLTRTSSDSLVSDPSAALVVDISTTLPSAPTISPLAPTNDNTPTMNGTAPANSKVDIYDANNNLIGTTNADANGNWTFTPTTPLPDGNYQLNAKATDEYGNTSPASAPQNLVIDTVAPAKPVITLIGPDTGASTTDKITSANILTITGTAEANSIVTIYDNGIKIGTATTNGTGQWTFTTPALADGSNRFSANATDAIGNKSVNADSYTMVIDSSAPSAPVINPLPSPLNDTTPNLSGTGEPGAIITILDGGNSIGTAVVDANGNWTFTPSSPLSDGSHTFTATQKDTAGNTSPTSNSVVSNIDSVPPAAPVITPPLGPTNDNTPTLNGTAEPNSIVKIYDGTTLIGTATTDGSGNWNFTPTTPLSDGVHNLSASSTDAAGNVSPVSDVVPFTIDTVAPLATNFSPTPGDTNASIYDNLVVAFSESIALGSTGTIELRNSAGTLIESFSVSSSRLSISGNKLSIDPTANLALGTGYYVTIGSGSVKDLAGNAYAGISSNTDWAFTTSALPIPPAPSGIDLQPASDTGSSNTDNITSDNTPTLDIALNTNGLNPGDIVRLYDNGVEVGSVTLTAADITAGKVSITSTTLADGTHSLTSKIEDANGTLSSASAPLSVVINTVPPTAPGTPDLAASSDTGSSNTDNNTSIKTPTFNGTGNPGDTISLYVDGVLAGTGVVDANGNYSITPSSPIADGVHAITTSATNVAGLTGPLSSPLSVTIDSTPPATPTTPADLVAASDTGRSSTDNITSDTTPDFSGTGLTPGNTVVLYVDGQPAGTATVDALGNWTVNVSPALADGSHTITYLVKDLAGNSSGFAPTMNITVDTAVPTKPTVPTLDPASDTGLSATDRITRDSTPTINGTGGIPGNDVTLKDGSGNIIGTGIVAADGSWSITPTTALADGNYSFTATYTSVSGVSSLPSDPISVVIDTVAPTTPAAPTISPINPSATPGHTNSTTPVFTGGTFLPGELVQLFVDGSTTPAATAIVDANGNYQIISPTLTDGSHTFAVKVTDAAGNISAASNPTSLVIDSRQPGSPTTPDLTAATDTGRSNTDNITSNNTPVFQGIVDVNSTAQAGDFVEIYSGTTLVGVGTVVLDANSGNLVWSVTVGTTASGYTLNTIPAGTVLADGTQAISAMFRTPGGFGSQLSQALTVVVDTTVPTAPSSAPDLAASSDTGTSSTDNLTNDTTPTFTGTGGVPGDTVNLYANGNLIGTAVVGPDGSYSVTPTNPLPDGSYNFTTNYVDPAGNASPLSAPLNNVVIDSTPPAVPQVPDLAASSDTGASNSDNITGDNTPTFAGFGTPGDTINIYVDGVLAGSTTVDVNGNWSITTNSIADGVHQITSQAIDPAGNASAQSTPLVVTIDTTAPNAPIFTTPSGPTSNPQIPINGTGEPGSTITLYDGNSLVGTAIVNGDGTWSITPSSPLSDGTHTFTSTATDGAGNVSPTSSPINITIDTVNPQPPVVISVSQDTANPSDRNTSDNTLTVTGTAEPNSTIKVYDGNNLVGTTVVGPDGNYSVTTSVLADGNHPLSIKAIDAAGNTSQPVSLGTWAIDTGIPTAPTVGSVSQDTGNPTDRITSDNTLTVTGNAGAAEAGTTIKVYDTSSGTPVLVGTATVQPDGSYSVTTGVLADGSHPLHITATDTAGNESGQTSIGTWNIDTAAPNAPSFGSVSQDTGVSANDKNTSDNTLTITGNAGAAEPGTTIKVYDTSSGTPVLVGTATVQPDGSYSVTTSVLADGSHPLSITATDTAGNESAPTSIGTWNIDTTAPALPVIVSISDDNGRNSNDRITSDNTLTFTGTAEPNSTVTLYGYIHNSNTNTSSTPVILGTAVVGQNGVFTITTAALADNLANERYVFSVDATDTAGNVSGPVSGGDWAISTRIPNPPVVLSVSQDTGTSSTDKLTKDSTLTITGTGNAGDTITIYDGTTPVGTAVVGSDGKWSVTTSVLADGGHNLDVTATSPLGFEGLASSAGYWNIDTVAPSQPVLGNNNGLPQVTGTANPGTTVSVVIGGATYTTPVDQNGNWTINLVTDIPASGTAPAINTGTFPISVYSTDAAGNPTTPTSSNLVVTTTVQPAPVFTSNPTTSDTTPLITGNSEIGSTVTLILTDPNNNNAVIATYSNVPTTSAGTWSVNLQTAIPDGGTTPIAPLVNGNSYNLSATATDANNQFTSVAATQKLLIDTTAPNTPVITSPAITNDSTPLFTGTAEPGSMIELTIKLPNGSSVTLYQTVTSPLDPNNPSAPGTWAIDFSKISPSAGFLNDLADGNYVVEVVAIDAALNRSPAAVQNPFIVDTVAPLAPVITSPSLTNDNTPMIAGTAEVGSTITLVIDGFTFTTQTNSSGQWSVDLQTAVPVGGSTPITALTDGVHPVTVTATDAAGNISAPTTQDLRVDTTPPATPEITSGDKTNDTTPVITGLAEPGSTVAVTINGATFNTIASPNGTWSVDLGTAIPNGGTTPIAPLTNGSTYPVSATATDAAGNTSQPATQNLLVDTTAPDAPVFTSSALTNQVPPTITGTAEPNSTLTLVINGATFTTPVDANGNWSVNTATATPISGTLGAFTDGNYPVSAYCTDSSNNQSGTSAQTLVVDLTAPVVTSAVASFGSNLNLDESKANATMAIAITGIEDGQPASVTINGSTFTGTVYNGKVLITVPAATLDAIADGTTPTFTVSATDRAGNVGTMAVQFSVDKSGPPRPSIVSVTSSQTDPNPGDLFTSIVNPTVVLSGQAGQTVVIHGPNGIVDPADYTVTETNGLYTITFTTNQVRGDYKVNLRDSNGNENADGSGAQNFFRIDSIPILFDNPLRRSTTLGSTYGNLGAKNILNGEVFNVPQQSDNTWVDLDGENLTFGLAGSTVIETDQNGNPALLEVSINGAVLQLNPITGAYKYTPVPLIDRMDTFVLTLRDTSGNQTQLQLTFNSIDTLDRDGIGSTSESTLAGIVTGTGNNTNLAGDLNRDGVADANQNSVTTLAWRREADFLNAINPNTAPNTDRAAIVCMVVNGSQFDPNTTTTLTQLMGNVDTLAQLLQIQVTNTNGLLPDSRAFYKPWDLMNFSVESLVSTGLNDINPNRAGTQIQVAIDISNANMPMGGFGFSLYRKYVSQQTLDDYAQAGITLRDLDNNPVTTPNWYDYTQRTPGGDGASFKDFNNDGKIDAIIVTLTDNAFGDDSPVRNKIIDPGTPTSNFPPNPGGNNPSVPNPPGSFAPQPAIAGFSATGTSTGSQAGTTVHVYPASSTSASTTVTPFPGFQGEVRIIRADFNNDGTPDIVASMGAGGLPLVKIINGANISNTLMEIMVYDRAFTGGIYVATGDVNHDGILDIVTGAGAGGGPHVKAFSGNNAAELASFFAYTTAFTGGVSVAAADLTGDGFAEIVTGAGPGGGPHVKVFNGNGYGMIQEFMAYTLDFTGGVYVSAGDYLSDGKLEIITGAGAGGGPHVKIWDYLTNHLDGELMAYTKFINNSGQVIDTLFSGGVRVALADANGDSVDDLVTGAGPGGGPHVEVFVGFRLELLMNFFSGDRDDKRGIFVGR